MTTATTKKTEIYKFVGNALWAKVYDPDDFRGTKNWKINLEVDAENLALYKKSGIQGTVKEGTNGPILAFKRPVTKLIKGVQQIFAPPKIVDHNDNVVVEYRKNEAGTAFERVGEPVLIGNGSVVELTVSVYPTDMGPGQRLEAVKIIDLIEYEKRDDRIIVEGTTEDRSVKAPW